MKTELLIVERKNFREFTILLIKYFFSEYLNGIILLYKKNKVYAFNSKIYKGINLGCSTSNPENWIGISGGFAIFLLKRPKFILKIFYRFSSRSKKERFSSFYKKIKSTRIIHHNLFYGIPFPDNSVPYIYTSHFLEHLTPATAEFMINECYRVLQSNGRIRIVVPSLDENAKYISDALNDYKHLSYQKMISLVSEKYSSFNDTFSHHRYMYNFHILKNLLEGKGFSDIFLLNKNEGNFPDLTNLEIRDGLIVEAKKY